MPKPASPAEEKARAWLSKVAKAAGSARKLAFEVWGEGNEAARSKLTKVISGKIQTVDVQILADVEAYVEQHLPHLLPGQGDGDVSPSPKVSADTPPAGDGRDVALLGTTVPVPQYGHVGAGPARVPPQQVGVIHVTPTEYAIDFAEPPRVVSDPVIGDRYRPSDRFGYFIIDGDSAAPVFFDRERVPVQILTPEQRFANDLLYVFRWQGEFQIKRLRLLPGGTVRAYSLNPSIEPFEFKVADEEDFAVVALARVSQKQQLYTALVGRFLRIDA